MTKTIKMSLVAALAVAGISASAADVKLSGKASIKYDVQKFDNNATNDTLTLTDTDVSLYLDAKNKDGVSAHIAWKVYDGNQAGDATGHGETEYAYIVAPLPVANAKLKAGLVPNPAFGSGPVLGGVAFENGGEAWKTNLGFKVAGLKVNVGAVNLQEGDDDTLTVEDVNGTKIKSAAGDDITKLYAKLEGKAGALNWGVQYSSTTDKNYYLLDNNVTVENKELTKIALNPYVNGEVAGIAFAAEYKKNGKDAKGSGFFVEAAKTMGKLTVGAAYFTLKDGMGIGDDFDLDVTDGSALNSSSDKDTSFLVIPVVYQIDSKTTAKLIHATGELCEKSTSETDLALSYKLGKVTSVTLAYGTRSSDDKAIDGDSQTSVKVATSF